MPDDRQANDSPAALDETILALCRAMAPGRTICPTDAAQAFAAARREDELGWRSHLTDVKRTAVRLADAGRLVIYRKGKPVDPHDFRGSADPAGRRRESRADRPACPFDR